MSEKNKKMKRLTTIDIVLISVLAIANGVALFYVAILNQILTAVGGPILTSITLGLYGISGVLAAYIIRKPGVAFFTLTLTGVVQVLSGNPNGLVVMTAGILEGIGAELGFALFRYKRWDWISVSMAGLLAVPGFFVVATFWFGYYKWGMLILTISFIIRCLSGIILSGWISKLLGDILVKTNILKGFRIDKDNKLKTKAG